MGDEFGFVGGGLIGLRNLVNRGIGWFLVGLLVAISAGGLGWVRSVGPRMYCYHNEVAPLRVVKHNGPNQGGQFYGCPHWPQKTYGFFFKWTHEVQNVDDLQYMVLEKDTALIELEHENKTLKKEVEELKAENAKLGDMVAELAIENTEIRLFMEATMADKKLAVALIISWVLQEQ
ncbi:DNA topoisomerase 3-alpha [Bienertia sinuspersici]